MNRRVVLQPRAEADLEQAYLYAAQRAPESAARWLNRFHAALQTLSIFPEQCAIAPESDAVGFEVRQFLFGRKPHVWRALFVIESNEARVLHIRRATMEHADPSDLSE
jgi:plasmid stabilization system protein ParE